MASSVPSGSKYAHLSEVNPDFAPLQKECDDNFHALWSLPPLALGPDVPSDLDITHQTVPVRDDMEIEIRVYKAKTVPDNAFLFLWRMVEAGRAPEIKFPYAVDDFFDVLEWCKANSISLGIDPELIIVGGGSAVGNIAAALAKKARDEGVTGIIGQVLNIPVTCHLKHFPRDKYEQGSYELNKDAPVVDVPRMNWFWDQYFPNAEPEVYTSPLLPKLFRGLPPAHKSKVVQVAGMDPLRDEELGYADLLKEAGVPVSLHVYPSLPHDFYMFPQLEPSSRYLQSVVDFVNERQRTQSQI